MIFTIFFVVKLFLYTRTCTNAVKMLLAIYYKFLSSKVCQQITLWIHLAIVRIDDNYNNYNTVINNEGG